MKKQFIYIVFLIMSLWSCSSSNNIDRDLGEYKASIDININKVYSWVNMMPGPDADKRFQVTGDIEIPQSEDFDLNSIRLKLIRIHQDQKAIFLIKPSILENKQVTMGDYKQFIFSTISGVKLDKEFNADEKIDIELIFNDYDTSFSYKILDVSIEKAY